MDLARGPAEQLITGNVQCIGKVFSVEMRHHRGYQARTVDTFRQVQHASVWRCHGARTSHYCFQKSWRGLRFWSVPLNVLGCLSLGRPCEEEEEEDEEEVEPGRRTLGRGC